MAGKSANSLGAKNWSPGPPSTRYNVSGKNREFYTFENAPGAGAYASGGTIIDGGDGYIYHIFTGAGTFQVNRPSTAIDSVDYLIVAGGGGGAFPAPVGSGGGGGGGMLFGNTSVSNTPGSYSITIGGGGVSTPNGAPGTPRSGSPSTAFGFTATGGGGGGGIPAGTGGTGGSGGGGGNTNGSGAAGNTPAKIPRQGYNGAPGGVPGNNACGGGGGAGGVGNPGTTPNIGGSGGPGRIAPEFPSTIIRNAIPAPVLPSWEPLVGPGGYAAGGNGGPVVPAPKSAPANSGYGGQGDPSGTNSVGGSGIVCIRYRKTPGYSRATGGTIEPNTHPEHPGVWRHIFTSPGTFEVTDPSLQWIDYLAVGGGGGGGRSRHGPVAGTSQGSGGGGGGGGFVSSIHTSTTTPTSIPQAYPWNPGYSVQVGEQYPVGVGTYPIGIGTGGVGVGTGSLGSGTNGGSTTIGSPGPNQIIAYGGGGGAGTESSTLAGLPGASGGGATKTDPTYTSTSGGTATPTPLIQGNNGGASPPPFSSYLACGGGGGGASAAGTAGPSPGATTGGTAGVGGAGWYSVLSPSAYGTPGPLTPTSQFRYFAGGGGAGGATYPGGFYASGGAGGTGGGGAGGGSTSSGSGLSGTSGTTNTGGGGGGARFSPPGIDNLDGSRPVAGNGGPGIVIIQYPE